MNVFALVAAYKAGTMTAEMIRKDFGSDIEGAVLSLAGALAVGVVVANVVDNILDIGDIF